MHNVQEAEVLGYELTADTAAMIDQMIAELEAREDREDTTVRFKSANWYDAVKESTMLCVGVGGIGSWVSLLLSRMHPKHLFIMDDDVVGIENMSGQLYRTEDIGKTKVDALADTIKEYSNYRGVMAMNQRFTTDSDAYQITLCGFDNMEARETCFKKWIELVYKIPRDKRGECVFIDGRLNAEKFQVITIKGDDYYAMKKYKEEYLFSDNAVEDNICSYKQTTFCAAMIASFMCNALINFLSHSNNRLLPFFQEYDATLMLLKQEL